MSYGAQAVWVGTRFVCAKEAGAPPRHQQAIVNAGYHDTVRTLIYTGRPLRVLKTDYIMDWETRRREQIEELTGKGVIPVQHDIEERTSKGEEIDAEKVMAVRPLLMGCCAGAIEDIKPAKDIVDEMISTAIEVMQRNAALVRTAPKL